MAVKTGTGDLSGIESVDVAWMTADEVAAILGTTPTTLRKTALEDINRLGFPCCIIGHSLRIPRDGFYFWCKYGRVSA